MTIPIISPLISHFTYFRKQSENKMFLLVLTYLLIGITDSIGVYMIFPIINLSIGNNQEDNISIFLNKLLNIFNVKLSFHSSLLLIVAIYTLKGAIVFIEGVIQAQISTDLLKKKRYEIVSKFSKMKYSFFIKHSLGYYNNIVTLEIPRVLRSFGMYCQLISTIIQISIYICACFILNFKITVFTILVAVIFAFIVNFISNKSKILSISISNANSQIQQILIQLLNFFKYIKVTSSFHFIENLYRERVNKHTFLEFKIQLMSSIQKAFTDPFIVGMMAFFLLYQVTFLSNTPVSVFVLAIFFYKTSSRISVFYLEWQKFQTAIGGPVVVDELNKQISKNLESNGHVLINEFKDSIKGSNISLHIGGKQLLKNINFTIPKNHNIAIVGPSGAGKTTLADVIGGLYQPQTGSLFFDDYEIREIDKESVRKIIGYVTQEPVVFNDTVANNISFWQCSSSDNECKAHIVRASKLSYCDEFIKDLEYTYDTILGDKGVKLSVGQRQRIAIARELFKDPQIVIFDEATSALDTKSEQFIQKSITQIKGSKTVILIAHRLSTIKNCDYIYVMNKGRIIEEGTFDQLYSLKGSKFHEMCIMQHI